MVGPKRTQTRRASSRRGIGGSKVPNISSKLMLVGHEKDRDVYEDNKGNLYEYTGSKIGDWSNSKKWKKIPKTTEALGTFDFKKTSASIAGTYHVDDVTSSYQKLIKLFGKPQKVYADPDKVRVTWVFKDAKGNIITLYDWKEFGVPLSEVRDWNIGGKGPKSKEAAAKLKFMIQHYN